MLYGLTGNPGTGKSIVASLLKKRGIEVLMLYDNFKELGRKYSNVRKHYETFGKDVINEGKYTLLTKRNNKDIELFDLSKNFLIYLLENMRIDMNYYLNKYPLNLELILNNKERSKESEKIFLDDIATNIYEFMESVKSDDIAFVKYSKLIERDFIDMFDGILITTCSPELQNKRLESKGYTKSQIKTLLEDRYSLEDKIRVLEMKNFDNLINPKVNNPSKFYYIISTDKEIKEIEKHIDYVLEYHRKINEE